jgi:hypothetical protein
MRIRNRSTRIIEIYAVGQTILELVFEERIIMGRHQINCPVVGHLRDNILGDQVVGGHGNVNTHKRAVDGILGDYIMQGTFDRDREGCRVIDLITGYGVVMGKTETDCRICAVKYCIILNRVVGRYTDVYRIRNIPDRIERNGAEIAVILVDAVEVPIHEILAYIHILTVAD